MSPPAVAPRGRSRPSGAGACRRAVAFLLLATIGPVPIAPAAPVSPAAATLAVPDAQEIARDTADLKGLLGELEAARAVVDTEIRRLSGELAREETNPLGQRIDTDDLRSARVDLDSARSRVAVIAGQSAQVDLHNRRVRDEIAALAGSLANAPSQDAQTQRQRAALDPLREQARVGLLMADALGRRMALGRHLETLFEQRLRLLQSRLRLDAVGETAAFARDPRVRAAQAEIAEHLRRAGRMRARIAAVAGDTEADRTQRRELAFEADDAVSRAFLRQNDLELILLEHWLDILWAVRDDDLMPLPVLRAGARTLADLVEIRDKIAAALNGQRRALDSQRALVAQPGQDDAARLGALADLDAQVARNQRALDAVGARLDALRLAYERVIGERSAASLLEQRPLPASAEAWGRVAASVRSLPRVAWGSLRGLAATLGEGLRVALPGQWMGAGLGSLALALGLLWGRRALARHAADGRHPRRAALARVLPGAIPAAAAGAVGLAFGIPASTLVAIVLLLLLWPAGRLGADLARRALAERAATGEAARFLRSLRLGLIPAMLVAALYILARTLPVAPILGDLLDRLAMLALLTLALPAFGLRRLLRSPVGQTSPRARRRAAFLARLSQVLPIFLVLTGTLGILGFANLAWAMLADFGWALAVASGLAVVLGSLSDLRRHLDRRLAARGGELESLWRTHFLEPGYRVCQLAAVLGAGWILLRLWGWSAQTPAVRWLGHALHRELFKVGQAAFTPADGLAALFLVAAALWIGGWSQQVAYRLAYRRVRDAGLRRALATFTQYVVIVAGVLLSLRILGFNLTALAVFAASLGVGIGFGLQNIVNNFFSGLLLLGERPLRVGDYVRIGDEQGYVTQIGIRSLTVRTDDRQEVIIPNAAVIGEKFTNWTRSDSMIREVHTVGIDYGDDRELAMGLIAAVLADNPLVLATPAPAVHLWEYADCSVTLRFQYHIDIRDGLCGARVRSAVLLEIGRRFAANGISFPFPRRDLTLALDPRDRQALALPRGPGDG